MTRDAVAQVLTVFEAAFRLRYSPRHVDAWEGFLANIDDGDGKRAAEELVRRLTKPPTLADVLSAAADIRAERESREVLRLAALPSGERRSLNQAQQFQLMREMWAQCEVMCKAGVAMDERARLLGAMAADRTGGW